MWLKRIKPGAHVALVAGALAAAPLARACGPFFPNCYVNASFSDQSLLPTLGFDSELQRLLPPSAAADRAREAKAKEDSAECAGELAEIRHYLPSLPSYDRDHPPKELPLEFQLYAAGARAWHQSDDHAAAAAWRSLLALPAIQRHYRSVWAAYMLGRTAAKSKPAEASAFWAETRRLAQAGFADARHLADASLGESALLALKGNRPVEALRLYWQQYARSSSSARMSIQFTLRTVFIDPDQPDSGVLDALAADPLTRQIVTAWFVSRGGPFQPWDCHEAARFNPWLQAVSRGPALPPVESDRWAWAAYSAGLWDAAQRFADAAPRDAPASEWIRAFLLLRRGKLDEAATHLANAARAFQIDDGHPPLATDADSYPSADETTYQDFAAVEPKAKLAGIRGCLALTREQYLESLRLFRSAGHDVDAQFVAEKVLTLGELKAFVDQEATGDSDLRWLLARRLSRTGRFVEARPYYPVTVRPDFDAYVRAAEAGYDARQPKAARAAAFWAAAQVMYRSGMELVGTALEPDFALFDGQYEWPPILENRIYPAVPRPEPLNASFDEVQRYSRSGTPGHRYHYRYRAAELAMLAASLSPDDDATTAIILATAGNWLSPHDPESAEIFYKTLVIRCPNTDLGRKAAAARWLPKI